MSFLTECSLTIWPSVPSEELEDSTVGSNDHPFDSEIREPAKIRRQKEFELLQPVTNLPGEFATKRHDHLTAPLMTSDAHVEIGLTESGSQYGVLGQIISVHENGNAHAPDDDDLLYINTNVPLSALVCGVQGSGKSHTVACILENMFIEDDPRIGSLSKSLSGLVLHMSEGGPSSSVNETAWVGLPLSRYTKTPNVDVYVSPSSLSTMKAVYAHLGSNVHVKPLYFTEDELDAQAFLSMMAVGASDGAPLYIQIVLSILRDLGEHYSYKEFKNVLEQKRKDFNPAQEAGLKQRMALLESFMGQEKYRMTSTTRFAAGQLTIVDLSDPFIDPASACGIFEVITRLFVRTKINTGKVLVVDEAHKYLASKNGSTGLTKALLTLIREQRHKGMRVIISTQEPTIVPSVLIDLCSVVIMHRFSSPSWWDHIMKHVSADLSSSDAFDRVVKLQTGEAIVLAPSGIFVQRKGSKPIVEQYGRRCLTVRMRQRITNDGGSSIMVVG